MRMEKMGFTITLDFEYNLIVGARQAALIRSEPADLQGLQKTIQKVL